MKKKNGFTFVELLVVLLILSILMVIAVPSIMSMSNKMKARGLNSKIEAIESATIVYVQKNSNSIKSDLGGTCKSNTEHCECAKERNECDEDGTNCVKVLYDCKYKFKMTVDELIEKGGYESENPDSEDSVCDIADPTDPSKCLDCAVIEIGLDDDYKSATAHIQKETIGTATTCPEIYNK